MTNDNYNYCRETNVLVKDALFQTEFVLTVCYYIGLFKIFFRKNRKTVMNKSAMPHIVHVGYTNLIWHYRC